MFCAVRKLTQNTQKRCGGKAVLDWLCRGVGPLVAVAGVVGVFGGRGGVGLMGGWG
jgi:hypothetical protein